MNKTLIPSMDICEIEKWADSRETSIEIAEIIIDYANTLEEAQRVWESPTKFESQIIKMLAFDKTEDDELYWGCETLNR